MRRILFILMFLFFSVNAGADTVILRSGQKISGDIVESNGDSLKVEFEGVALTYYMDEIQSINGRMVDPSQDEPPVQASQPRASSPQAPLVIKTQRGDLIREATSDKPVFVVPEGEIAPAPLPDDYESMIPGSEPAAAPAAQPEIMGPAPASEPELALPEAEPVSVGTVQEDLSDKEDFADLYARMRAAEEKTGQAKMKLSPAIKSIMVFLNLVIWAVVLVLVISNWVMFDKAGQPGWAAIIPFYNLYILLKIARRPGWWLLLYFLPVVSIVITLIVGIDIAKNFGKGVGFGIGIFIFPYIFVPILAFGSATYGVPLQDNPVEPLQAPKLNLPE